MPDVEAPEIELDDDAPQFRRRLAIVVVLITLFGAGVAYLHEQNGNFEDNASREAQIASVRGFGQQLSALTDFGFDYDVFVQHELLERRVVVASARQSSSADSQQAGRYGAESDRYKQLRDSVGNDTRVQDLSGADALDSQLQRDPDREQLRQQVFANKANDYGNKADSYVAVLTVLAVGLFLIGLSLTVGGRGRYFLAIPGVIVALVCVVWAGTITLGSITKVSDSAIDLTADGQQLQNSSDPVADPQKFHDSITAAIDKYHAAIKESPDFGAAWARLSDAEFESGLSTSSGGQFQSISDPDATKRAIDAGEKAISLGEGDASLLSSIGFYHFTIVNYGRAEELSAEALQSSDQFPPLIFNLGVVQVAKGEADAARATYQRAIDLLADKRFDVLRTLIISAARTDLDIAVTSNGDVGDLAQEMKGLLAAAEFPDSADAPEGANVADAQIDTDRFRLFASYSADGFDAGAELTNIWYFRPLDKNGNGPFQQVPEMDRITLASDKSSGFVENGTCLPGGDYRMEVYAGHNLLTTVEKNIGDSPLGTLQSEGGEEIGFTLCRPANWQSVDLPDTQNALGFTNPDNANESVLVFSFPVGTGAGDNGQAILDATIQSGLNSGNITPDGPSEQGSELLGRDASFFDVELPTTSVQGTDPKGQFTRITASLGIDGVIRVVIVTAANSADLDVVRSELVNSIRFLRVPPSTDANGG